MKKSDEIKHRLRTQHGMTLKAFAEQYGFPYLLVSHVLRGINRATFGKGREIADKLNELVGAGL